MSRGILKDIWRESPPSRFLDYRDFLRALRDATGRQVGRYPFIQFSADLGLEAGNIAYMVLHGYRKLSRAQAETVAETLGIRGVERRYLLKLIDYADCRVEGERRALFQDLVDLKDQLVADGRDRLMLRFFGDWHHAAIFELVDLPEFRSDPEWIAERFYQRLSTEQVRRSLALLTELELVRFDEAQGKHVKTERSVKTGDDVQHLAAVGYHLEMLSLAQAALSSVPADQREITATTLAVDAKTAARLHDDVRLFRKYAVFLSEQCEKPDRILQLNSQMFSVTKA